MSAASTCDCPCPDPTLSFVPGSPGLDGPAGASGDNGLNAFTFTTADFLVPAIGATVAVPVISSAWAVVGQNVFVLGAGTFEVVSKPNSTSMTLEYLNYVGNTAAGNNIVSGAQVSPGGTQPSALADPLLVANGGTGATTLTGVVHGNGAGAFTASNVVLTSEVTGTLPIANGGTNATTKGAAQVSLGLGQDITETDDSDGALAYDITNTVATVTGITAVAAVTGLYLVEAGLTVLYTGVTFAADRALTIRTRNTTAAATISEKVVSTGTHTTATFPAIDYVLPPKTASLTAADSISLQTGLDVVESAGSSVVSDAWISLTPLALA